MGSPAELPPDAPNGHAATKQIRRRFINQNRSYVLIVIAGFMLNFTACGVVFAYGVFQAEYEKMSNQENNPFTVVSSAEIALIGSLGAAIMKLVSPFVVAWCKCFGPRPVVSACGLIFGLAHVLASFGTASWHFHLAQGVMLGTGIGGLIFAPVIEACIASMGFRNTLRLVGCVSAALIWASGAVFHWKPSTAAQLREEAARKPLASRLFHFRLPSRATVKQSKFIAQVLNGIFQSAAYNTPVFYISSYAQSLGYSASTGANFTSLSNACNAIGKIAIGFLADYTGRLNAFFGVTLFSTLGTVGLWVPSTLVASRDAPAAKGFFIVFTISYGLFASAYVGLFSPVLVELFGRPQQPRISSVMYAVQGAASLLGTPLAGLMVRSDIGINTPRGYLDTSIFVTALLVACTATSAWVLWRHKATL
ncbi:MFS general substrate transporter [Aspergillus germanicus]